MIACVVPVSESIALALAAVLIVAGCFAVGAVVQTRIGGILYTRIIVPLLRIIPGYTMLRGVAQHVFAGEKPSAQFQPAMIQLADYEDGMLETAAFVSAEPTSGQCTIFIPTSPFFYTGIIFRIPASRVRWKPISRGEMFQVILSGGAGWEEVLGIKDEP